MEPSKIILFISKESASCQFIRRLVEDACARTFGRKGEHVLEVVDVAESPEMAERYRIEALPTLCVGDRRLIGLPTPTTLATCLSLSAAPDGSAAGKK